MRVIGGEARGRKIVAPNIDSVRPTSDRVREAMFDVLAHLGVLGEANVLDLFAGSGALGIEALSRGASSATFVDSDQRVLATIKDNLASAKLGHGPNVRLVTGDAIAFCRNFRAGLGTVSPQSFDVTLCDPPYSYSNWPKLLAVLPGDLVVLESGRSLELPSQFDPHRIYKYGSTLVTVARQRGWSNNHGAFTPGVEVGP